MTERVREARRALVASGALLHERHACGDWTALGQNPAHRSGTCPVCTCRCEDIPVGDEPPADEYERTLF